MILFKKILFVILLFKGVFSQESEVDYMNLASQKYILSEIKEAKKIIESGLKKYSYSKELLALKKKIEEEENKQKNQNQNKDNQNKKKENKEQKNEEQENQKDQQKKNSEEKNEKKPKDSLSQKNKLDSNQSKQDKDSMRKNKLLDSLKNRLSKEDALRLLRSYKRSEKEQLKKILTQPKNAKKTSKQDW